jgi:Flp pilus assembly secretin CpaC
MPTNKLVPVKSLLIALGCLATSLPVALRSQTPVPLAAPTPNAALPQLPDSSSIPGSSPASSPGVGLQALPQNPNLSPSPTPATDATPIPTPFRHSPNAEPGDPALNTSNSFWLDNYPLNDLYQYLARQAEYQFFQNPSIDSIRVTGELFKGNDPLENMRELALQYNLVLYQKGRTLYALTQDQIATLPQQEFRYELKYLHPKPEDIQRMLGHFLSDHGSATLEPQINTIVVSDNETVIPKIARYLQSIDVARRQISIQVRVISITMTGDKYTGVDWSGTLGKSGLNLSASAQSNLDATFGFKPFRAFTPPSNVASAPDLGNAGTNVILGPVTVTAVLHALYDNARVHEESAPLVITEDNQPSTVRVVTRTPIITSTVTVTNGVSNISTDVRYYLDSSDVAKNREIGTTLLVTPSILPDNTIRLQIDGTVATIESEVTAQTGTAGITNSYPVVNESHLVNLSRVPSGYSLILGGLVSINTSVSNNKVPVLGSIPLLGQAFRYKQTNRSRTNLAFIITPIAFQAGNPEQSVAASEQGRAQIIAPEHDLADPHLFGPINQNATDFHNAISTGQFQSSDKNPVKARKQRKMLARPQAPVPQTQSANPDEE